LSSLAFEFFKKKRRLDLQVNQMSHQSNFSWNRTKDGAVEERTIKTKERKKERKRKKESKRKNKKETGILSTNGANEYLPLSSIIMSFTDMKVTFTPEHDTPTQADEKR
jgi:hypothetical protein